MDIKVFLENSIYYPTYRVGDTTNKYLGKSLTYSKIFVALISHEFSLTFS